MTPILSMSVDHILWQCKMVQPNIWQTIAGRELQGVRD